MLSLRPAAWLRRWNYDVRVRSHPVASEIKKADPNGRWSVLDAGSGETGLAALLPGRRVVGLDRTAPSRPIGAYVRGSALELPFHEGSWDIVTCIDVLEHLPASKRARALAEILRVSRRMAIVAFPYGDGAREADREMAAAHRASGLPVPRWLDEHLRHPPPEDGMMCESIQASGGARIEFIQRTYHESLALQRVHRFLAVRSLHGYRLFSMLCGFATPWLARPIPPGKAYRCTIAVALRPSDGTKLASRGLRTA